MSIPFDIEERTEDALVSLLRGRVNATLGMLFYPSHGHIGPITYPSAGVFAFDAGPVSEGAEWHFQRILQVQIMVATERTHEQDSTGQTLRTARQRNQDARSLVMNALTRFDDLADDTIATRPDGSAIKRRSLLGQILDQGVPGVAFAMAQVTQVTRGVEQEANKLTTAITMEVIAEPVELNP
jgi:hypothetical protein